MSQDNRNKIRRGNLTRKSTSRAARAAAFERADRAATTGAGRRAILADIVASDSASVTA